MLLSFLPANDSALLDIKKRFCKSKKSVVGFVLVEMDFRLCGET